MCIPKWALPHNKFNAKTDKWKYSDTEATLIFVANWSKGSNFNLPTVQKIICLEIHDEKQTQRANLHQITFNTWTWKHFLNSHVCYCYKDYKFSISPKCTDLFSPWIWVGIAQRAVSDWKARHNTNSSSNPQCCKGFFSQSQLSVQTLLQCPYSPGVQLHASTSVCMLKIPNTGIHIVWTHKNTAHSDTLIKMGSVALVIAVPYSGKVTQICHRGQWNTKNQKYAFPMAVWRARFPIKSS